MLPARWTCPYTSGRREVFCNLVTISQLCQLWYLSRNSTSLLKLHISLICSIQREHVLPSTELTALEFIKIRLVPFSYTLGFFLQLQISRFNAKTKVRYQKYSSKTILFNLNMSKTSKTWAKTPTIALHAHISYRRPPNFQIKMTTKCYWPCLLLYGWN